VDELKALLEGAGPSGQSSDDERREILTRKLQARAMRGAWIITANGTRLDLRRDGVVDHLERIVKLNGRAASWVSLSIATMERMVEETEGWAREGETEILKVKEAS